MIKKLLKKILEKYKSILFVGSTDILPEPLSKEEEIKYVELSMNNDKYARNKLIEHNLRLVVFLAKKYDNTGTDLEDLVSIGTIGLIKAVNTYRLDKNIKKVSKYIICRKHRYITRTINKRRRDRICKIINGE